MKFVFPSIVVLLTCFSCADKPGTDRPVTTSGKQQIIAVRKPPGSFQDTLIIEVSAAVFFNPDSAQLAKIKSVTSPDEFETSIHTSFYLKRNSKKVLHTYWPKIRVLETSRARFLLFRKANKEQVLIDLNEQGEMSGLFLFDGKKAPELADMMNIDTALGFYFAH